MVRGPSKNVPWKGWSPEYAGWTTKKRKKYIIWSFTPTHDFKWKGPHTVAWKMKRYYSITSLFDPEWTINYITMFTECHLHDLNFSAPKEPVIVKTLIRCSHSQRMQTLEKFDQLYDLVRGRP